MRDIKVDTRRHSRQCIVLCFVGIQIKEALARVILSESVSSASDTDPGEGVDLRAWPAGY
ncbi:hypothetical protein N7533_008082 [Penicillium manginii]|uniref:uncharacterized protein n=1 Tax=Penicillium manginii TaxID=203109 RepID=UPI0025465DCE|nr:uncharacterized protein N7533_008082 [Penicillium manginii]KAJ5751054.1 hypothetical protein N7533_008082 [Penicillium manginii]